MDYNICVCGRCITKVNLIECFHVVLECLIEENMLLLNDLMIKEMAKQDCLNYGDLRKDEGWTNLAMAFEGSNKKEGRF